MNDNPYDSLIARWVRAADVMDESRQRPGDYFTLAGKAALSAQATGMRWCAEELRALLAAEEDNGSVPIELPPEPPHDQWSGMATGVGTTGAGRLTGGPNISPLVATGGATSWLSLIVRYSSQVTSLPFPGDVKHMSRTRVVAASFVGEEIESCDITELIAAQLDHVTCLRERTPGHPSEGPYPATVSEVADLVVRWLRDMEPAARGLGRQVADRLLSSGLCRAFEETQLDE